MICFFLRDFCVYPGGVKSCQRSLPQGRPWCSTRVSISRNSRFPEQPLFLSITRSTRVDVHYRCDIFDLPGVYCRSLISSWRNKGKEIVLGQKEGKREAQNPNLSRKYRTISCLVIVYIVLQAFRHLKSTAKIS